MSETAISVAEVATEPETEISETDSTAPEFIDPLLDDSELFSLVSENANVLVTPSWLGVEIPLSAAMYQIVITRENVHAITAEVRRLLANRLEQDEETEEPREENQLDEEESETEEEEDEPEQESDPTGSKKEVQKKIIKTEISEDPPKPDETNPQRPVPVEPKNIKASKSPAGENQKSSAAKKSSVVEPKLDTPAELLQNKPQKPLQSEAKAIPDAPASSSSLGEASIGNIRVPKAPADTGTELKYSIQKPAQPVEADHQEPVFKPSPAEIKADSVTEVLPAPAEVRPIANQATEPATENADFKSAIEPGPIELAPMDNEPVIGVQGTAAELTVEKIEANEDELISSVPEYLKDSPVVFNEDQLILLEHSEPTDLAEVYEPDIAANVPAEDDTNNLLVTGSEFLTIQLAGVEGVGEKMFEPAEITPNHERAVQANLPIESIETALQQLSEFTKTNQPEASENLNPILDKISEVSAKVDENSEAETQEELEELFVRLFEESGVDYTPELVESLAAVTITRHLLNPAEEIEDKIEKDDMPHESGTHEIIKKLLAGISTIKKALAHAYVIGRSALLLYRFSFAV
ncbi:MAG TPA: hypothetical protein VFP35_00390 [Candidatus Saccharimonadales bacterium]|nr:hypothetical protein [Candidatus Saccharimonadales bacterium]